MPTPRPEDPRCVTSRGDRFPDPARSTAWSARVVIATVVAIDPTRWSTPDGQHPANPHDRQADWLIFTPVEVRAEQTFKDTPAPSLLIAAQFGTIGDDCVRLSDGRNDFASIGERVVLFLDQPGWGLKQLNGTPLWWISDRYTITPEESATNADDTRPLADLVAVITAAANTPASPSPAPSGTPVPIRTP